MDAPAVDSDAPAWRPTREAAFERLEAFVPSAGREYAARRNTDTGPGADPQSGPNGRDNVSCLSPWLRHRLILEEEVVARTLQSHSLNGAEKFIAEVFWRTYFKGWLEHRPEVWSVYLSDLQAQAARLEKYNDVANDYAAAINGETGIAPFDAWARELVETNYLHNHARMWFASIWIFTLRLPWQLGADFFLRHLLDGDPASNTLSWRWVGGLHTKGKTYLARASNIAKFTDGRFGDAERLGWQLANDAPPLEEDFDFEKGTLTLPDPAPDAPYLLLITEEDGYAEGLRLRGRPVHVASTHASDARSPVFDVSDAVMAFSRGCVDDAAARAVEKFDCAHTSLDSENLG
ncbi:MAG: FAD-binding domain-containing protein, partial [Pseudomonadota bacterium]